MVFLYSEAFTKRITQGCWARAGGGIRGWRGTGQGLRRGFPGKPAG